MKHPERGDAPPGLAFLEEELAALDEAGLLRKPATAWRGRVFCSNDYLGLAERTAPPAALGSGGSRLVSGTSPGHIEVEAGLAAWLGLPGALVFSSGYAANVGLLGCLARPGDLVVSDALNHASIVDGVRLSRAEVAVVPHLDLAAIEDRLGRAGGRRAFVVVESYFSMDADSPDLAQLRALCDRHGAALLVDEAHALGVFGPGGRGLCAEAGIVPDALVGTFGKAFGGSGAFVAGSSTLRHWLWNRARSFVFSTGMSPAVARGNADALFRMGSAGPLRAGLEERVAQLRAGLLEAGLEPLGRGHIVPVVVGPPRRAVRLAELLADRGFLVQAIRPPTVPAGSARLRFTCSASHSAADVAELLKALREALICLDDSSP